MNHFFVLALFVISHSQTFTATLSSSLTLAPAVAYLFNFTFSSRTITASSSAVITLTSNYNVNSSSLTNCMYATTTSISYTSTSCGVSSNSSGYYITFGSIYPSQLTLETVLSLKLQMHNPWGAGSENVNIMIMDSGGNNLTTRQTVSITYTVSPLNSCQWISNSNINGATSTRTVSFIPSVQLIQTSYLQVTIPLWFNTSTSAISNVVGSSITCSAVSNVDFTPSCSYTTIGSTEVYTISNMFSSNKSVSNTVAIGISSLLNPWSLYPFSPISFQLFNNQNGIKLTQSCSGISQTTTALNTFTSFTISSSFFTTINAVVSNRPISFKNANPIPSSGGQLRLSWSSGPSISYTGSGLIILSQSSSQITFNNFTTTDILSGVGKSLFGWTFTNPPSTRPFTITLTSLYSFGGTTYGIDTSTNTYNCSNGVIATATISSTSYAINAVASYTFRFTTINALTTGSYISIVFPSYTSAVIGSSCSSTNSFLSCSVANSSYLNISVGGAVAGGTSLTITVNSANNPNQAMTTASFGIYTYYDSGLDSLVDRLITGLTLTALANQLSSSNVFVIPSTYVVYASSNYIFSIQLLDPIRSGGYFSITFPSAITLSSVSIISASFPISTCVLSVSGSTLNITSCFSADYSTLGVTLTLGGVRNPNSVQPTSSFSINTYGPVGLINYISSGLTITMTNAATSSNFSLTPQTLTVHATSNYTLYITFTTPQTSSNYMILTIPSSMQFSASPSCSVIQGIALVGCSLLNTSSLKMVMSSIPSGTISFTIMSIRNYDIGSWSIGFVVSTYNSGGYLMETTSNSFVSYSPDTIITYSVSSNNQIVLNQASNITITFTTPFTIDSSFTSSLTGLYLGLPVGFTTLPNSTCTSNIGTGCTLSNSSYFSVTSPGLSVSASITLSNIKLPYLNGSSSSFDIGYTYNGLLVASVSSGVVVTPYCTSPCEKCSSTPTVCLSCLPTPNIYLYYYSSNNSCFSSCPSATFINGSICSDCVYPCKTCSSQTTCITCVTNTTFFALNSTCLSSCPTGYFTNTSNCSACVLPCSTCTSASACLSCSTNYLTNYTCVNASACPTGTYANSTTKSCDNCQSPCLTCDISFSSCTSCVTGYSLYNFTCLNSCPATMYANSSVCVNCSSPCSTCTSQTFCLTCISLYIYNGSCLNSSQCPSGTFPNATSLACESCALNCSTCSTTAGNCTTCRSPYFAYNGSCVNTCPSGLFQNASVCVNCISPCATCTTSTTCLSCSINYFYNYTCTSSCPSGTFANVSALNCDPCAGNCSTCSNSSLTCTSCNTPTLLLNSSCVSSCTSGMFSNGTNCVVCSSICLTCSSFSVCLSCSTTFLTNNTCVTGSNCPTGTFANTTSQQCDSCISNCTTCNSLGSNCTSCSSPNYLYNQTCTSSCPSGYFQNITNCSACVSPCNTCTNSTICLSCLTNFYSNFSCVNASSCPAGTYGNTANNNCDPCSSNCSTCFSSPSNCTACTSPAAYYNNTCLTTCPSTFFKNGTICDSCIPPCATCTSSSICLSCSYNYFSNYSCVNASSCPTGTFGNTSSNKCDSCTSNCTSCFSSSDNCSSCTSPYALYNSTCINSCPSGTFQNGTICQGCVSPCSQCSTNLLCISCVSGYYYSNQSCVSASLCPNGTYANTTLLNCSACTSPCVNCFSLQNNCTSCISSMVLNGNQCSASCPALMYNNTGTCSSCTLPCGNCTSGSYCLSCVSNYLSNGSCVSSGSCPSGTYAESSNNTCNGCFSPCVTCNTASNCSSCIGSYYYFSFTCVLTCPNGTYSNSTLCSTCDNSCLTCTLSPTNCTSCGASLSLFRNTCVGGCPTGTYNFSSSCLNCSNTCYACSNYSVCTACTGNLFLTNNSCLGSCLSGTYADTSNNQCSTCTNNCLTCSGSGSNCSSCSSSLLFYSSSCIGSCPTNYFNVSGVCTTCPNCNTCTNATSCFICASGFYLYSGGCYSSCPSVAPIPSNITYSCSPCGVTCSSCNADGTYCFTCSTGYLLLTGQCYTTCPSGYTADSTSTKCNAVKTQSTIYFPFTISLFCISILSIFSKVKFVHSDLIGNLAAFTAFSFFISVSILTFPNYVTFSAQRLLQTSSMETSTLNLLLGMGITIILCSFILGCIFVGYIWHKYSKDPGVLLWKKNYRSNRVMFVVISILSCFHFAIFRFIYSKIFLRECFSCYFKAHKHLLMVTNIFTFICILFSNVPSIALSVYLINKQEGTAQTQILAVDNIVISSLLGIFLLIDMGTRNSQDFQNMLQDFPYLKRTKKYQDLDSSSGSLISINHSEEEQHYKTEVDPKEKNHLKDVNIDDQLGNFGAISQLQNQSSNATLLKTLPEFNRMNAQINFNPFELKRINDDLFFQEKEYTKKFNQIKEQYKKGIFQQDHIDDQSITNHNDPLIRGQNNVEEIINQRKKEIDPQMFLNKFKSEDYDDINEEQMALLMQLAQQKGLDPKFMKETFGKNKYFNHKILEEIFGDHQQVSKESAQALLNDANNQSKLREILGQKSNICTDKLIEILNDPHYREIIEAMFNKETGFLSIDAIKDLLADNKKFSKQFIIRLLNNQIIENSRLKSLIQSNKEGQLDALNTIKELGGDELEKEERMSNLLGRDSLLNPTVIPKIKKQMSELSTANIFDSTSESNKVVIKKVINNKRINLQGLNPIQQMPEILQEFAQLLNCGNEDMQQDLIQLLEDGNFDGEKLKQLIRNSGNSQEEMAQLLSYIKENKQAGRQQTPVDNWEGKKEESSDEDNSSLPSLNFSINQDKRGEKKKMNNTVEQQSMFQPIDVESKLRRRTRYKKKQPKPIHLPSQEIYLQRLQAPHEVQRNKKFRNAKKKIGKVVNKFMDEENEVYDLDF